MHLEYTFSLTPLHKCGGNGDVWLCYAAITLLNSGMLSLCFLITLLEEILRFNQLTDPAKPKLGRPFVERGPRTGFCSATGLASWLATWLTWQYIWHEGAAGSHEHM
eukprot:152068-Pelagomonas_calceolata.AAC.1